MEAGQSRHRGKWSLLARFGALLLVVAFAGGALVVPAGAAVQHPSSGQISFYSDLGNMANKSSLVVRPATLYAGRGRLGGVDTSEVEWLGHKRRPCERHLERKQRHPVPGDRQADDESGAIDAVEPRTRSGPQSVPLLPDLSPTPASRHCRSRVHATSMERSMTMRRLPRTS